MDLTALPLLTAALGAMKHIHDLTKDDNKPVSEEVMEVYSKLADVHLQIIKIVEENIRLVQENEEFRKQLKAAREKEEEKGSVVPMYDGMWQKTVEGYDGPFCPTCWDDKRKLIRMSPGTLHLHGKWLNFLCPVNKEHSRSIRTHPDANKQIPK